MMLFILILFFPLIESRKPKVPQIPVSSAYFRSPLDDEYTSYYDDPSSVNSLIPSLTDFASLPTCQHSCTKPLSTVLGAAIKAKTAYDRFFTVCEKYNETLTCMKEGGTCGSQDLFDVLTSGLKYMCYDQRAAFEASLECIDGVSSQITRECNTDCRAKDKFTTLIVDSGLLDLLIPEDTRDERAGDGERTLLISKLMNPQAVKSTMKTSCDIAKCFLACIQSKYNVHCGENVGNLLTEAIVKPIAKTHEGATFAAFGGIMRSLLPETCNFLVFPDKLRNLRMDPDAERQLQTSFTKDNLKSHAAPLWLTATEPLATVPSYKVLNSSEAIPDSQITQKLSVSTSVFEHGELLTLQLRQNEPFSIHFSLQPKFEANLVCSFEAD